MTSQYDEILKNDIGEYKTHQFIIDNNFKFIIGKCSSCLEEKALIGPNDSCNYKYCTSCYIVMGFYDLKVDCPTCGKDITSWVRELMFIKTKYIFKNFNIYNPNHIISLNYKKIIGISSIMTISTIIFISFISSGPISPILSYMIMSSFLL